MRLRTEAGLALGTLILAALLAAGIWLRDRHILETIFGEWSAEQVSNLSGGVYRLAFSRPRFNWERRHVRVDSIRVSTDPARLPDQPDSLPHVSLLLRKCELSGVAVVPLALGRGLSAHRFGCDAADLTVEFPASHHRSNKPTREKPFLVLSGNIELPRSVPSIRINGVMFPRARLALGQRRLSGARVDLTLVANWRVRGVDIDPADSSAMRRPLFSQDVTLEADSLHFTPEAGAQTHIGHIRIGVTDSTLELRHFAFNPARSGSRTPSNRRDLTMRAEAARVAYAGLDLRQLTEGNGLRMRRLEVDSARLDLLSDQRQPAAAVQTHRLTPQQWVRELDRGVRVDTVVIRGGSIVYRELQPGSQAPGVLTFTRLNALATNVRHDPDQRGVAPPMRLRVIGRVMDEAKLDATFTVPLDAPDFALAVRGRVGAMDVTEMNRFMERVSPFQIKSGRVDSIAFGFDVRNGIARGTVVPLYKGLALDITGQGMSGLLGGRGIVSGVARGVVEVAVNRFGVRRANPDQGKPPREGRVDHPFSPSETLPAFLWNGLRDGLVDVIKVSREKKEGDKMSKR